MAWTDNITNTTKIRKIHVDELRSKIDSLAAVSCPTHNSADYGSYKGTVKSTQYTTVYSSYDSTYRSGDDSSYNTATYATYQSSYNSSICEKWGWNASYLDHGFKGPCYIMKQLINKMERKVWFLKKK